MKNSFLNEAILENIIDPSPHFGLDVNADAASLPLNVQLSTYGRVAIPSMRFTTLSCFC